MYVKPTFTKSNNSLFFSVLAATTALRQLQLPKEHNQVHKMATREERQHHNEKHPKNHKRPISDGKQNKV